MYNLYLDEFGHENALHKQQMPIFGYGGILIPSSEVSKFATHFFDLKLIANFNLMNLKTSTLKRKLAEGHYNKNPSKLNSIQRTVNLQEILIEELKLIDNDARMKHEKLRILSATHEVKGEEVFSKTYLNKMRRRHGSASKLRGIYNLANWFVNTVTIHGGEFFYCGFHKGRIPLLRHREKIHVKTLKDVLYLVNRFAVSRNTTVNLFFDRHHTDGQIEGFDQTKNIRFGRYEYARNLIIKNHYYNNITEPIFTTKSHWSQCIQAADWTAYLLGMLWAYKTGGRRYKGLVGYYDNVGVNILKNTNEWSLFKSHSGDFQGRLIPKQEHFDFDELGHEYTTPLRRPYLSQ